MKTKVVLIVPAERLIHKSDIKLTLYICLTLRGRTQTGSSEAVRAIWNLEIDKIIKHATKTFVHM